MLNSILIAVQFESTRCLTAKLVAGQLSKNCGYAITGPIKTKQTTALQKLVKEGRLLNGLKTPMPLTYSLFTLEVSIDLFWFSLVQWSILAY